MRRYKIYTLMVVLILGLGMIGCTGGTPMLPDDVEYTVYEFEVVAGDQIITITFTVQINRRTVATTMTLDEIRHHFATELTKYALGGENSPYYDAYGCSVYNQFMYHFNLMSDNQINDFAFMWQELGETFKLPDEPGPGPCD